MITLCPGSNTTAKRNVELLEELAKIFEAETKKRIALEVALKTIAVSHSLLLIS